jgi:hypothetical protein
MQETNWTENLDQSCIVNPMELDPLQSFQDIYQHFPSSSDEPPGYSPWIHVALKKEMPPDYPRETPPSRPREVPPNVPREEPPRPPREVPPNVPRKDQRG